MLRLCGLSLCRAVEPPSTGEKLAVLLSFRVENHESIREEQQLLLTPTYGDARPESADREASTVAGIFGRLLCSASGVDRSGLVQRPSPAAIRPT